MCYGLEIWHKSDQCTEIDEQICFILSHLWSVLPRLVIELFMWLCNPTWTPDGTVDPCGTWAAARLSVLMCIYCKCMPGANRAFTLSIEKNIFDDYFMNISVWYVNRCEQCVRISLRADTPCSAASCQALPQQMWDATSAKLCCEPRSIGKCNIYCSLMAAVWKKFRNRCS